MKITRPVRIVVITSPDQIDQEWINRLAHEPEIEHVERVGSLAAGIGIVQKTRPDIVLVDRDLEQTEATIKQIFIGSPSTVCLATATQSSMQVLRRLVSVGARDVIAKPIVHEDLMKSIRDTLSAEFERRTHTGEVGVKSTRGKLVVMVAPKGGVGTTTIGVNLAVALRQISGASVAIADFDLQFGDVGVHLNVYSKHTLADLLPLTNELDESVFARVMQEHAASGVHVLLGPDSPEIAGDVTAGHVASIIDAMRARYAYVICDTWSFIDEIAEELIRSADELIIVMTPEVPALKNARAFLEYTQRENSITGRTTLVLNRFPSVDGISLQDVQKHLRHPVIASVPSEGHFITQSVNRGVPVVIANPKSWVGQSLVNLAVYISGDSATTLMLMQDQAARNADKPSAQPQQKRGLLRMLRGQP